jgi:mono/diheme cytochrome c family protein
VRRRLPALVGAALILGAASVWFLGRSPVVTEADIAGIAPDPGRGEAVFWAMGCASCHAADGAQGDAKLVLSGGHRLVTPFGTFVAPNISQDPEHGIGGWSRAEIVSAVRYGTAPDGRHYYPAFPYAAYGKATTEDLVSLAAYLETLPADPTPSAPHELGLPFSIRLGIGAWKFAFTGTGWVLPAETPEIEEGRYLAEALAHCGECHTPRNALGGLDTSRWFAGAPNPSGEGRIPNITPAALSWSAADIAEYLKSGFTPEFDTAGGSMAAVVAGTSRLTDAERAAIAAYVKSAPPVE